MEEDLAAGAVDAAVFGEDDVAGGVEIDHLRRRNHGIDDDIALYGTFVSGPQLPGTGVGIVDEHAQVGPQVYRAVDIEPHALGYRVIQAGQDFDVRGNDLRHGSFDLVHIPRRIQFHRAPPGLQHAHADAAGSSGTYIDIISPDIVGVNGGPGLEHDPPTTGRDMDQLDFALLISASTLIIIVNQNIADLRGDIDVIDIGVGLEILVGSGDEELSHDHAAHVAVNRTVLRDEGDGIGFDACAFFQIEVARSFDPDQVFAQQAAADMQILVALDDHLRPGECFSEFNPLYSPGCDHRHRIRTGQRDLRQIHCAVHEFDNRHHQLTIVQ